MSNPIPRVGTARPGVGEVPLDQLIPLHSVPRPGKVPGYIAQLANEIQSNGYQLSQPIPVFRMPDGRLVMAGGHHRAEAMRSLGETTIPARVVEWDTLDPAVQKRYEDAFPGVF
jgi:ParB-like chromosome segregation protein Spo0J